MAAQKLNPDERAALWLEVWGLVAALADWAFRGICLAQLWNWFLPPLVPQVPRLAALPVMGLILLLDRITWDPATADLATEVLLERRSHSLGHSIVALGIGALLARCL